jgi:hypothetical protein
MVYESRQGESLLNPPSITYPICRRSEVRLRGNCAIRAFTANMHYAQQSPVRNTHCRHRCNSHEASTAHPHKTLESDSPKEVRRVTYLVGALDREVPDEDNGQADGAHDRPDELFAAVELTVGVCADRRKQHGHIVSCKE